MTNSVNPTTDVPGADKDERTIMDCVNDLDQIVAELRFISYSVCAVSNLEGDDTPYATGLSYAIDRMSDAIKAISAECHELFIQDRKTATAIATGEVKA